MDSETSRLAPLTPIAPLAPPQAPLGQRIFFGKDGLRPGWGLLCFIAILVLLGTAANFVTRHVLHHVPQHPAEQPPVPMVIGEVVSFGLVFLATWIMSRIEGRNVLSYGLAGTRRVSQFFAGLGWGVVFLSALVGLLWKTGFLVFDGEVEFGANAFRYGALWLVGFLFVGLFEELLTRGYLLYTMARCVTSLVQWATKTRPSSAISFWFAALITSGIFLLAHTSNKGESPFGLFSVLLAGLFFCLTLWRTGSLWWAIGFHASWDWAQTFLFGVADSGMMGQHHFLATHPVGKALLSGGATGPEGSVFLMVILGLASVVAVWTLPEKGGGVLLVADEVTVPAPDLLGT